MKTLQGVGAHAQIQQQTMQDTAATDKEPRGAIEGNGYSTVEQRRQRNGTHVASMGADACVYGQPR
ncbi:hypothetical protein FocTR4_00003202 [Fusarium oxysporum f. sp. cubense]|uniref:Uncharacterized protein n=1 Tax=Fusarium oxysporum f. sp. cubense TaxID=61366 RepID=A0A5C6TBE4_FUSOC|nr:hypothetical protein FocTR4_00003202 [Fusarium oxysporum f. sp. cubense]